MLAEAGISQPVSSRCEKVAAIQEEKNNWRKGELLSIGRALCDSPDCGIEGDNPNERFGAWVSVNFTATPHQSLYNFRRGKV